MKYLIIVLSLATTACQSLSGMNAHYQSLENERESQAMHQTCPSVLPWKDKAHPTKEEFESWQANMNCLQNNIDTARSMAGDYARFQNEIQPTAVVVVPAEK